MKKSGESAGEESQHFLFDYVDDTLDTVHETVKESIGPIWSGGIGTVQSYSKRNFEIVLWIGFRSKEFDLCFRVVPKRVPRMANGPVANIADLKTLPSDQNGSDQGVLVPVAHLVHSLFVMTLGHSRKSVRLLVFRSSSSVWAELHEKAFRRLGGVTRVVVLDNLREGVITQLRQPLV